MRKYIIQYFRVILIVSMLVSCEPWPIYMTEIAWEGALGGSILFEYNVWDDYGVYYRFQEKSYRLAYIAATDCNEILTVMKVSHDETHLVLLVTNSSWRGYPHGTRLLVFDLSVLPDDNEFEPLLHVIDPKVLDATISNDKVEYLTPDGELQFLF
jgi:hypothetical protein